jgi:hypothetical protein
MSNGIEVQITDERMADLLCNALEGGSNYWYVIVSRHEPPAYTFHTMEGETFPHIDIPMNDGGWLMIASDDEPKDAKKLDKDAMRHGLHLMAVKYPHHFADVINENDDAITGDVFLQLSLFGEVVYG